VVSYAVAQRTSEFGIRMALGAPRTHVLRIVFESTVLSIGCGMAAGLALTLSLQRLLAHWAEGSSRDPAVVVAAALLLSVVAVVACSVPARRASTGRSGACAAQLKLRNQDEAAQKRPRESFATIHSRLAKLSLMLM
jgi:ABC-type lipoprotein release transport system permease subunit